MRLLLPLLSLMVVTYCLWALRKEWIAMSNHPKTKTPIPPPNWTWRNAPWGGPTQAPVTGPGVATWQTWHDPTQPQRHLSLTFDDQFLRDAGQRAVEDAIDRVSRQLADVIIDELGQSGIEAVLDRLEKDDPLTVKALAFAIHKLNRTP